MKKNVIQSGRTEESDFCDNCLNYGNDVEPINDEDAQNDGTICPYCGNEIDFDQAYVGRGQCLCPYCGARFGC